MAPHRPQSRLTRRLHSIADRPELPRRTVRLRLTLLYGGLFIVSGAALLTITYLLVAHSTRNVFFVHREGPVLHGGPSATGGAPLSLGQPLAAQAAQLKRQAVTQHNHELHQLLIESGLALAIMSVLSLAGGWVMAGRVLAPLETAFEAQRRFVANASHELRTPLTMMRTSLDVATGKPGRTSPEMTALEGKLREGLDQADRLVESFLTLARAQNGAVAERTEVALPELAATALGAHQDAIAARGLSVQSDLSPASVAGNWTLLARMVDNVIDNAVRHNQDAGFIRVATQRNGASARVTVESGGAPLADSAVAELAQPFQRLGGARRGSEHGVGLGLSIVDAIAQAHGGALVLEPQPDGGLRVMISLPTGAPAS
jgi:signal transduction histidine kinase